MQLEKQDQGLIQFIYLMDEEHGLYGSFSSQERILVSLLRLSERYKIVIF